MKRFCGISLIAAVILLMMVCSADLYGQQDTTLVIMQKDIPLSLVVKHDGTEFVGRVLSRDQREILIETEEMGRFYVPIHVIRSITELSVTDFRDGRYLGENIFATRYFINTNGLPLKKGDKYGLINLYGPEFQAAVLDNFTLGIITSWVAIPVIGSAKYSFALGKNVRGAAGVLAGTGSWALPEAYGGLAYGSVTLGDNLNNVSFSAGYAGVSYEDGGGDAPLVGISGLAKIGERISFVGDSFIYAGKDPFAIIIPGLRFSRNRKGAFQFGFAGLVIEGEAVPFPMPFVSWFIKI